MTEETMKDQLETLFNDDSPATPKSGLAVLWMDTAYRLAQILLGSTNRERAKEKQPPLVPGMRDLQNSMQYIGSFDTYFCEAIDGDDGTPIWVPGNKANLRSIAYGMFSELTSNLLNNAEALKGVELGETALGVVKERRDGIPFLPDGSGPALVDFAQPVASKIAYYAFRLISIIRSNGGANEFAPKSSAMLLDILNIRDITINDLEDMRDDPYEIDHPNDADVAGWDIFSQQPNRVRDVYNLSGKDLENARETQKALKAWFKEYDRINDNNESLREEVEYQVESAKEWVKNNRKQQHSPVVGVAKS